MKMEGYFMEGNEDSLILILIGDMDLRTVIGETD